MLDIFNIPSNTDSTKIFYAQGATTWQTWNKPRGAKMIQIFCLGSGGSGAIGAAALNGSRSGGGGGGSGAITRAVIPAFLLPDILYIQVGLGGAALNQTSTTAIAGNVGAHSYISLAPSTAASTVVVASSTVVASGGTGNGSNAAGGTVFTSGSGVFSALSIFTTIAGVFGNGFTTQPTPGTNQAALGSSIVTGGTAGGPTQTTPPGNGYAGGSITSASVILTSTVAGGTGISTAGIYAPAGDNGYTIMNPFCSTGGAGGGGNGAGTGGWGGDGGLGSGGGGGGGGGQNGLRRSGKGGDGLVIITTIT
jgi:hypothetical protein